VFDSFLDALGMGAGFTAALLAISTVREIAGSGTWFGYALPWSDYSIPVFTMAPGGFIVFGLLIAVINKVSHGKALKRKAFGCASCPSEATCVKRRAKGKTGEAGC
jgi:electron transport complex protein RnfE